MKQKDKKKSISFDISNKVDAKIVEQSNTRDGTAETSGIDRKSKRLRSTKKQNGKITESNITEHNITQNDKVEDKCSRENHATNGPGEEESAKTRKKKRNRISIGNKIDAFIKEEDIAEWRNDEKIAGSAHSEHGNHLSISEGLNEPDMRSSKPGRSKETARKKSKSPMLKDESLSQENVLQNKGEDSEDDIHQISSGDEDSSRGMKKWIMQYHQSRPGLKVLQEKIDDFIMAHEAQEEQARKEREAEAAEGGWTVVVHHRGRKKTTDAESGIAVGSVAQKAVLEKMAKKKTKDVGLEFYRFQKREAHRNEIMMLQSKFEQDKIRIQQMRAARKFRPY